MNASTFSNVRAILEKDRFETVSQKRPEYTEGNPDVFHNFKQTALELGITPQQVAYIFMRKHLASIAQLCSGSSASSEPLIKRFGDAMNYLEFIFGILYEQQNSKTTKTL